MRVGREGLRRGREKIEAGEQGVGRGGAYITTDSVA